MSTAPVREHLFAQLAELFLGQVTLGVVYPPGTDHEPRPSGAVLSVVNGRQVREGLEVSSRPCFARALSNLLMRLQSSGRPV
jgi:hypothetical protein